MLSIFVFVSYIIPWMSDLAGYSYIFMKGFKLETPGQSMFAILLKPIFYKAIITNMYLFVVANMGVGKSYSIIGVTNIAELIEWFPHNIPFKSVPAKEVRSITELTDYFPTMLTGKYSILYLYLLNLMILLAGIVSYIFSSQKKKVLVSFAAMCIVTIYLTFLHSPFGAVIVHATFFYGALSIPFLEWKIIPMRFLTTGDYYHPSEMKN